MRTIAVGVALGAAVAAMGTVLAKTAEDDLAVVKRAVARQGESGSSSRQVNIGETRTVQATPPSVEAEPEPRIERRRALSSRDLRWFKVRVTEKGAKRARVNVNLPIALVRALGDDFPIDIGRHMRGDRWRDGDRRDRRERVIHLGDILATLEAGQSLVEIDDDDATVRVWVE